MKGEGGRGKGEATQRRGGRRGAADAEARGEGKLIATRACFVGRSGNRPAVSGVCLEFLLTWCRTEPRMARIDTNVWRNCLPLGSWV
jgi:hypothetical protein